MALVDMSIVVVQQVRTQLSTVLALQGLSAER